MQTIIFLKLQFSYLIRSQCAWSWIKTNSVCGFCIEFCKKTLNLIWASASSFITYCSTLCFVKCSFSNPSSNKIPKEIEQTSVFPDTNIFNGFTVNPNKISTWVPEMEQSLLISHFRGWNTNQEINFLEGTQIKILSAGVSNWANMRQQFLSHC